MDTQPEPFVLAPLRPPAPMLTDEEDVSPAVVPPPAVQLASAEAELRKSAQNTSMKIMTTMNHMYDARTDLRDGVGYSFFFSSSFIVDHPCNVIFS